jgi:hypothetical protein
MRPSRSLCPSGMPEAGARNATCAISGRAATMTIAFLESGRLDGRRVGHAYGETSIAPKCMPHPNHMV